MKKALKTTQCYAQQDGGGGDDADGEEEEEEKFKQKAQRGRNDEEMAENGVSEVGLGKKSSFREQYTESLSASSLDG